MTRLYLVRHGEVEPRKTFYGHLDLPLSPRGMEQMRGAAEALAPVRLDAVYSSDLQRAALGARLIADGHGLTPGADAALREMCLGALEGLPWEEVRERYPELAAKRYPDMFSFSFPGGETLQQVGARVRPALSRLLEVHVGQTLVIVAHNSVNRIILGDAIGLAPERIFCFEQDLGCINCIDFEPERVRVGLLNWTPSALVRPIPVPRD
jgi:alpha-ribazole phosphatase